MNRAQNMNVTAKIKTLQIFTCYITYVDAKIYAKISLN